MRLGNRHRGSDLAATIDHVTTVADGGSDELANLRLAHYACNQLRGAIDNGNLDHTRKLRDRVAMIADDALATALATIYRQRKRPEP